MQRILFINPPRWHEFNYTAKGAMGGMANFPPLGMLYISSYLKANLDVETKLFDFNFLDPGSYDAIDKVLDEFKPDIVGITTFTLIWYDVVEIAKRIKKLRPNVPMVLGGKHVELYPHESFSHDCVDYVIVGEGEKPMAELVGALGRGEEPVDTPGLWRRGPDGQPVDGGRAERNKALDDMPRPDRSIVDPAAYAYRFGAGVPEAIMITSRGCPYTCAYCMSAHADRDYIYLSPENVVGEIEEQVAAGYNVINFFDDYFNINIKRTKAICRLIIERGLKISWTMRGSAEHMDQELAHLLAKSGCDRAIVGVESASEELLLTMGRKQNNTKVAANVRMLADAGVSVAAYFMLGFPGETREQALSTIDLAVSLPLDYAQFTQVFPAPGSPLFARLTADGRMEDIYREFTVNPTPEYDLPFFEDVMNKQEVDELCQQAYRRFYFRPSLIFRHVRKLQSPKEFYQKARIAAALAKFSMMRKFGAAG